MPIRFFICIPCRNMQSRWRTDWQFQAPRKWVRSNGKNPYP